MGAPAAAQVAGTLSLDSDYRVRGYSISGNRAAATLDLSYDDPSGVYVSASATGGPTAWDDVALVAATGNIGYARRVSDRLSIDGGVTRVQYPHLGGGIRGGGYTELYLGAASRGFSTHLYYSPDYFHAGVHTLYGEIEGATRPLAGFRLNAHVGALARIAMPTPASRALQYDWRLAVSHRLGPLDLHVGVSSGGPRPDYYNGRTHDKTAVVGGAAWTF